MVTVTDVHYGVHTNSRQIQAHFVFSDENEETQAAMLATQRLDCDHGCILASTGRTKKSEIWCWCDWHSRSVSGNSSFFPQWILRRMVVTEFMENRKISVVSVKIVIASCFRSLLSCSLWIVTVAHALDRYCLAPFGSLLLLMH